MKTCKICGVSQHFSNFFKYKNSKDGLEYRCKSCMNTKRRLYHRNHKEARAKYDKMRRKKDGKKINKQKVEYIKTRRKNDISFRLSCNLRNRLYQSLKNNQKMGSAVRDLGCSTEFLKYYLESKFKPGMSWDNWKKEGWHIDHIIPISKFDLTNKQEFLKVCHYTNLQPLWATEHLKKTVNERTMRDG